MMVKRFVPELSLTSQRNEFTQPLVAQEKSSPDHHADIEGEEDVGEEWIADAHVRGDSAAKIACQQDRAKNRGLGNSVEERTDQQHDPDRDDNLLRISQLNAPLHGNRR